MNDGVTNAGMSVEVFLINNVKYDFLIIAFLQYLLRIDDDTVMVTL